MTGIIAPDDHVRNLQVVDDRILLVVVAILFCGGMNICRLAMGLLDECNTALAVWQYKSTASTKRKCPMQRISMPISNRPFGKPTRCPAERERPDRLALAHSLAIYIYTMNHPPYFISTYFEASSSNSDPLPIDSLEKG
jgi:hypothetical protein